MLLNLSQTGSHVSFATWISSCEKKIKFKSNRRVITKQVKDLLETSSLNTAQAIKSLEVLTKAFIYDKSSPYTPDNLDLEHANEICGLLGYVNRIDSSSNENTTNTTVYFRDVEILVNQIANTFPAVRKTNKLLTFSECFREMSTGYPGIANRHLPYSGDVMKVSDKCFSHGRSVLLLPENPKDAVAALFNETPRFGAGVKAHFGNALGTLAIRTLLVHCSESADIPKEEIGFGRIARTLDEIVVCKDGSMRVVFQGRITASKYIRTPIPVPTTPLSGRVKIKATLCYATAIDPHHPENYTRSGLEVSFRPDKKKMTKNKETGRESTHAATKTFFGTLKKEFQTELELRRDALKWENCMHAEKSFLGTSLNDPVFDIHYNARMEGHNDTRLHEIQYALVITVEAPKVIDLYDQVVRRYATQLEQLVPVIDIPIRV